jgi:hypothetical protein
METLFPPPRRTGLIFQVGVGLLLMAGSGLLVWRAALAPAGTGFLISLFFAVALFAPVPLLAYRAYALVGANYALERDGLQIRWGLRAEDIPLPEIEWIRPASDLVIALHRPLLAWPGGLLGTRQVEGLGPVEFIASDLRSLLLVATPQRVYAISPANPRTFMKTFQVANEMGSLAPIRAQTIYPTVLIGRVWDDRMGRVLLMAGFGLGLILLIWVSLAIPTLPPISLGFLPNGQPGDPGPAQRLLLLPILNGLTFLVDTVAGLYFYRKPDLRSLAYTLWGSGLLTPTLLMLGVFFILKA